MTRKTFSLAFILSIICSISYAQSALSESSCIKRIEKNIDKWSSQRIVSECDICLEQFPNSALLLYYRGDNNYLLNHMRAAAEDWQRSLELGIADYYEVDEDYMRFISDTTYIIQNLTDSIEFLELVPELGYRKPYTRDDTLRGMLRPERTCFDIKYQNLLVKIIPETKSIEGSNEMHFIMEEASSRIQLDLSSNFKITRVYHENGEIPFSRDGNSIFLDFKNQLEKDKNYVITVDYNGKPRIAPNPPWDGGFTWNMMDGRHHIGVSCEHLGASSWWVTKDHLTDKPDSMDINIIALADYEVVSNGNLVSRTNMDDGFSKFRWHVSYPINNYNVTFYIGDFVNYNENYQNLENETVAIDYYVLEKNLATARTYYAKTKRVIEVFEKLFGSYAFPKDGLAFVESPFAGMEHQSAIAIGGDYGKDDDGYEMMDGIDRLVVHEAAHEWWGNAVAVGDMADIWISEGFATYSEHLFDEVEFGRIKYLENVSYNMYYISNIWAVVGTYGVNDSAFRGQDVYYKGAAMLHSLRCVFNDDKIFFKMIKDFYQTAKWKISTTADFTSHAQQYTKTDLTDFFKAYLFQSSPPVLEYSYSINKSGELKMKYRWTNVGPNFQMPFLVVLNDDTPLRMNGSTMAQEISISDVRVDHFHLVNFRNANPALDDLNAFTYYFAKLTHY